MLPRKEALIMRNVYTNYPPCPHGVARTRVSADGLTAKCSDCLKIRDRNRPNAKERNERFKKAEKERRKDPEIRKKRNELKVNWLEKNHVKRAAHIIVGNAIRDKRLTKEPCEKCGETNVDGHHDDYEKPLEVRWLCKKHHAEHHKQERENKR